MWSGPRNISTALMRSWGNRPDTWVSDEPLYAHYLARTGKDHPGADEVLAHQEQDWRVVVEMLTGPVPEGRTIWYQKHMAHHLLPEIGREWLDRMTHCFLIRDPARDADLPGATSSTIRCSRTRGYRSRWRSSRWCASVPGKSRR